MAEQRVSAPSLARLLNDDLDSGTTPVSDDTVNNWRKGLTHPRLEMLPRIGRALRLGGGTEGAHDPTYLLRRMGLLPAGEHVDAYALAYRIQKLDLRWREALERNAQAGRDHGIAVILNAVRKSQRWAVAIWPAVEGPADCRMHVADRIDFQRLHTDRPVHNDEVFHDEVLHSALREAYAVPSTRTPRWSGPKNDAVSTWSISHVGAPMSPHRRSAHPGAASVLCYALTVDSWVNDIASLLALALGYGLTTTRDLAMEVTRTPLGKSRTESLSHAHSALLAHPPGRRVWSHHAPAGIPCPDPFAVNKRDVPVVWVRETDALLEQHCAQRHLSLDEALRHRNSLDSLAAEHGGRILRIDADASHDTAARWAQVLHNTVAIFRHLDNSQALHDDVRSHWEFLSTSDPGVAKPFLQWLRTQLADSGN